MKKPNSVCKHCRKPIEVCLGESPDSTGQCKGYVHVASRTHFCPGHVAEPAEPSATSGITQPVEMDERGDVVRAEPTADYHCPNCNAPDYKGTCKSCKYSAHHEHLPAAPQPVAGEEPQVAQIKTEDYWIAACLHILLCPWSNCGTCNLLRAEIAKEHPDVKAI